MKNLSETKAILTRIASFAVFKNFLTDVTGEKFLIFLEALNEGNVDFIKIAEIYSDFVSELYNSDFTGDWSSYVRNFVLTDENVVSTKCSSTKDKLPEYILNALNLELRSLSAIASINFEDIKEILLELYPDKKIGINSFPAFDSYKLLFTAEQILNSYKTYGYGIISRYFAFKFDTNLELNPCLNPDDIKLDDLKLYEYQKEILKNNTLSFLSGKKANNILLYGDRGCGKSSSVKAIANEYKKLGLKIIQIYKENLCALEELNEYLGNFPSKFIIFIDDLVFDEDDPAFASAKAVLEGSLTKHPDNVLIYATTNRRHLIKETFTAREGSEIHLNDTMDEAASLSDRFGLTITFSSPDKKNYLEIVRQLAKEYKIEADENEFLKHAETFALMKGNRAPRVARQFLAEYIACRS